MSEIELSGLKVGSFDSSIAALPEESIDDGVAQVEEVVGGVIGEVAVFGATLQRFDRIQVGRVGRPAIPRRTTAYASLAVAQRPSDGR